MGASVEADRPYDPQNGKQVFKPTNATLKDVSKLIPARLHVPNTPLGLYYFARDIVCVAVTWYLGTQINPFFEFAVRENYIPPWAALLGRGAAWFAFWVVQSLSMTSLWVLGHEAGHRSFSTNRAICDTVGFLSHSFTGTPYFSWKITHHIHHSFHGSQERDAHHIPKTRSERGVPQEQEGHTINYAEFVEDTPIYNIIMLLVHQAVGFQLYLATNLGGQPHFPASTSHYNPYATSLFKPGQRLLVATSAAGIGAVIAACFYYAQVYDWWTVTKYYIIPWMGVNHWIMVIVFIQHTDPRLPHYRSKEWTYTRGAACTIDRPLLGDFGRFFFHDVAHYHVAHHLFPRMPFYHCEEATEYIKEALGDSYVATNEYWMPTLWKNFVECMFVEDEGQVLFYKNKNGETYYDVDE